VPAADRLRRFGYKNQQHSGSASWSRRWRSTSSGARHGRYALDAAEKAKARYAYPVGMRFAERARDAAAKGDDLTQEWIWASVLMGDMASLTDDIELANRSYDQALARSEDRTEQRWIANKRHELRYTARDDAKLAYYVTAAATRRSSW
jgi:hypothetical protein